MAVTLTRALGAGVQGRNKYRQAPEESVVLEDFGFLFVCLITC